LHTRPSDPLPDTAADGCCCRRGCGKHTCVRRRPFPDAQYARDSRQRDQKGGWRIVGN
jgi:hypothetical protein